MGDADDVGQSVESPLGHELLELTADPLGCRGVVEGGGAHLDRARAGGDELEGVAPAAHSPTPTMGAVLIRPARIAPATCHTARTAIGRIAGPESPPVAAMRCGRNRSTSMATPRVVLIIVRPWAPALRTVSAISTMSVTSGLSFASIGRPRGTSSRTRVMTLWELAGSQAKTRPRLATLGHEMLTSMAATALA